MIIYKRKKKQLVIPCGLGPVVCPDTGYDLQAKTVDSSTVLQIIEPDSGYYGMYRVTINPLTDDNLLPGNIKAGVEILGVLGTYAGELIKLQAKQVDPSVNQFTVTADASYDGLSSVTVNAVTAAIDPDIQAENIKKDVEILGVVGTFEGGTLGSKTVNSSTVSQTVTPDMGDYGLSSVTVNPYMLDSKTVNSSTVSQTVTSDADGLSSVTVNPYTLESKLQTITVNGTYTVTPNNADGLSSVDISVNVADIPAVVQTKSVTYTQNGEYQVEPDEGYDGLSHVDVSVNVPAREVVLQSKSVDSSTVQQSVNYDQGYDGLSHVTVEPYELDSKTVNSSTSSQTVTSDKDGLSSVTVNPYTLDSKTVNSSTSSQTVVSDVDGLSSVTVNPYTLDSKTVDSSTVSQTITSDVDGLSSVTVNPYTLDSKTIDPSTSSITVNSSVDGLSSVTVNGVTAAIDPDIQAGNIKKDVEILGVIGTFEGGSLGTKTVNSSTSSQTVTPDASDYGLSSVTVNPYTVESKSATLTSNGQYTYTATNADALSQVTIDVSIKSAPDLQSKTVDSSTSQQTVQADSSYDGLSQVTIEPYILDAKSVDPSTNSILVNSDADGLSSVTVNAVTAAIDPDIIPGNIRTGVNILGVDGSYGGYASDWYFAARRAALTDVSTYSIDSANYTSNQGFPYSFKDSLITTTPDFSSVTVVKNAKESFAGSKGLTSVEMPNVTEAVLERTFADCTNIADVSLPKLKAGILTATFANNEKLKDVSLPSLVNDSSVYSLVPPQLRSTFINSVNLESAYIPNLGCKFMTYQKSESPQNGYMIVSGYDSSVFFECDSLRTLSLPWYALRHAWDTHYTHSEYNDENFKRRNPLCSAKYVKNINFTPLKNNQGQVLWYSIIGGMQLNWNKWLSNETIVTILQKAGPPFPATLINGTEIRDFDIYFYDEGLTILDTSTGTYQDAYDYTESLGYTIHNLTINQSDNLILTSPKRIEPATNAILNLNLQQTISFDSSLAWTASVSDASVSISNSSGNSGSNTITVSYESGWTGNAIVTITNGECTRKVKVKKPAVTYTPLEYIDMNQVYFDNGYVELENDLRSESVVDVKLQANEPYNPDNSFKVLSTSVRNYVPDNSTRLWEIRGYNTNIRFAAGDKDVYHPLSSIPADGIRVYCNSGSLNKPVIANTSGTELAHGSESNYISTDSVNIKLYPGNYKLYEITSYYYGVSEGATHHYKPVMIVNNPSTNDFKIGMYDELNDLFYNIPYKVINNYYDKDINLEIKTVDSSTSSQTVVADSGYDGLLNVIVNPVTAAIDSDITSGNIKSGVTILGVTGTFAGGTLGSKTVDSSAVAQTITPDASDYGLSSVTVNPYTLDSKTIDSSTVSQTITSSADGLSSVTVNPYTTMNLNITPSTSTSTFIPGTGMFSAVDAFGTVVVNGVTSSIDSNIAAGNIKSGVTILGVEGTYIGQNVNNQNKTVDSSIVSQSITADAGYTGLGTVTVNAVTSSIDSNIAAGNIKTGVTILGVTGTYEPLYDNIYNALLEI